MLLKNARVLNSTFTFSNLDIEMSNGKIDHLYSQNEHPHDCYDEILDLQGLTILPGLIDIHTHGCAGYDTMDATYDTLNGISQFMAANGITSFLPTTMSESYTSIKSAFTNIKSAIEKNTSGAHIAGIHMEGPYFSNRYKGAQNEQYLKLPSLQEVTELEKLSSHHLKIISIAPELEGALEFIKAVTTHEVVVSLGHTASDYDTAVQAIENGASHATHLFNGMIGFTHRHPGIVGAVLDKNITVELICDGIHLHPAVIRLIYRITGADKIVLVSDSMRATGLEDGQYEFGGQQITVKNSIARTSEGNIAGSTSTLLHCVKKAVEFGIPLEDAIKMATINPAGVIGIDHVKGSIQEGKDADLVVVNNKFEIEYTFIKGEVHYTKGRSVF